MAASWPGPTTPRGGGTGRGRARDQPSSCSLLPGKIFRLENKLRSRFNWKKSEFKNGIHIKNLVFSVKPRSLWLSVVSASCPCSSSPSSCLPVSLIVARSCLHDGEAAVQRKDQHTPEGIFFINEVAVLLIVADALQLFTGA